MSPSLVDLKNALCFCALPNVQVLKSTRLGEMVGVLETMAQRCKGGEGVALFGWGCGGRGGGDRVE